MFIHPREAVFLSCRIMVEQKLDSGPFGNISVRVPHSQQYWINPEGITFDQITPEEILLMNTQGKVLEGNRPPHPGEFIHREIYKQRPDVNAIVHTHSENTVALSLLGCLIQPFTQLGAALYGDQGFYSGFTGPVRTSDEGAAIAQALGSKSIVIAKNHGLFATSQTIQAALWDMIVADAAAKIHLTAKQLGVACEILPNEYLQKSKVEVRDRQCDFMWRSYVKKIQTNFVEQFSSIS